MNIKQIEASILAFLNRLMRHLPADLNKYALLALGVTQQAEKLLNSGIAITAVTLDPALEPYREAIMAILAELEVAFKAVAGAYQKGALLTAQAQITGALHGNILKHNRYYLAACANYSNQPGAETKEA